LTFGESISLIRSNIRRYNFLSLYVRVFGFGRFALNRLFFYIFLIVSSSVLAVITQDSGSSGASVPCLAGVVFLMIGGIDWCTSRGMPRLFIAHDEGRLSTTYFIEYAEQKEWRRTRGQVFLFCAVSLLLVSFVTVIFSGRWPVAVVGAGLLTVVTVRVAGFWPLRRSPGGGWLFRGVLPDGDVMSVLRDHPYPERHVLAWTQTGRLSLLRRAAADAAQADSDLLRLLAARHASDSLFPRVNYRGGGMLADFHLLWSGGRLVGQLMALSSALALILSMALPRGALGTWPDLSGLPLLESFRDEAPKEQPKEKPPSLEDKSQDNGSSGFNGEGSGADGAGELSAGQNDGGDGDAGQGGARGRSRHASVDGTSREPGSFVDGSSSSGETSGQGELSNPSGEESGSGASQARSGGGTGDGAGEGQGAAGQPPSTGADGSQGSDPGDNGNPGTDAGGQAEAHSSTADTPSRGTAEVGAEGPAGQSPSAAGEDAAQGSDLGAGGRPGDAPAKGDAAQGANSAEGAGGSGPADGSDADPTGKAQAVGSGDQSGTAHAGAGGPTDPAEAVAVTEGPVPETGSTSDVALPSKGQGEADIPPDALVLRGAGEAPDPESKTTSVGSVTQLYAEPGQAPDTIETRLFPDETAPPPPVVPDPPRQMLPAWIRLILEENR
jgi:hypothetical protein